jgi:hypothetical protein
LTALCLFLYDPRIDAEEEKRRRAGGCDGPARGEITRGVLERMGRIGVERKGREEASRRKGRDSDEMNDMLGVAVCINDVCEKEATTSWTKLKAEPNLGHVAFISVDKHCPLWVFVQLLCMHSQAKESSTPQRGSHIAR